MKPDKEPEQTLAATSRAAIQAHSPNNGTSIQPLAVCFSYHDSPVNLQLSIVMLQVKLLLKKQSQVVVRNFYPKKA